MEDSAVPQPRIPVPASIRKLQPNIIRRVMVRASQIDGIMSLGGGRPREEIFPITAASIQVTAMPETDPEISGSTTPPSLTLNVPLPRLVMNYNAWTFSHGLPELCTILQEHMMKWHAPPAKTWDLCATSGSTDGINKLVLLLTQPGDVIFASEYCYSGVLAGPQVQGRDIVGITMDSEGLLPEALSAQCAQFAARGKLPRVLYLIPTGQNPTGSTLSVKRRKAIYAVCRKYDLFIIEDDPYFFLQMPKYDPAGGDNDSEVCDSLMPSLLSMDTDGRVIRLDSFSKTIAPGLRLGWVTGPREIIDKVRTFSQLTSWSMSGLPQSALVALLKHWGDDGFERHVTYLRRYYTRRRDALLRALDKHVRNCEAGSVPDNAQDERPVARWTHPSSGMFVWIEVPGVNTDDLVDLMMSEKVAMIPGSGFYAGLTPGPCPFLRATFAALDIELYDEAAARFARVLKRAVAAREEKQTTVLSYRRAGVFGAIALCVAALFANRM